MAAEITSQPAFQLSVQHMLYFLYFIIFQLATIVLGSNFLRIRQRYLIHPRTVTFLVPLIINYAISNLCFRSLTPFITTLLPCLLSLAITIKFQKVRIIGNTGGISTGKSTLTKLIKTNFEHIDIIDCDQISRNLRKRGQPGYNLLKKLLGDRAQQYINPLTKQIGEQQRKKLNQYVFSHQDFRRKLTYKMGQLIIKKVMIRIFKNIITGKNIMVVDAPLLYQSHFLEYICFPVVVVGCSQQTQIKRLMERDGYSQEQAKKRISTQMPLKHKIKKAQIYLSNQGTEADLIQQFSSKIKRFLSSQIPKGYQVYNKSDLKTKKGEIRTEDDKE